MPAPRQRPRHPFDSAHNAAERIGRGVVGGDMQDVQTSPRWICVLHFAEIRRINKLASLAYCPDATGSKVSVQGKVVLLTSISTVQSPLGANTVCAPLVASCALKLNSEKGKSHVPDTVVILMT